MTFLAIPFPNIDPVALEIGPFAIKWYGLAYMAGLLLGWLYIRRLLAQPRLWPGGTAPFPPDRVDDLLLYMTVGVVVGGRLGFVLLYEPGYYLQHPLEVFHVWRGGMAFHGALLGSIAAICLFAIRNGVLPWIVLDLCAAATPLGLMFGRLANFINGELFGRPSDVPWAMVFPDARLLHPAIEPTPRHPSQLYEAMLEGLVLFLVLRFLTHRRGALQTPGLVGGVFMAGYGTARAFAELFREPHEGHPLNVGPLTAGIAYSVPMILLGLWGIWRARRRAVA
jgi:phosphatidylglycerol:prolipoprotein diacylglycerol transferase